MHVTLTPCHNYWQLYCIEIFDHLKWWSFRLNILFKLIFCSFVSIYFDWGLRNLSLVSQGSSFQSSHSMEHNNRVFGRFRSRTNRESSLGEDNLGCSTVDLRTSTIKIDAEDTDLRLCFRIISPLKTYTLQVTHSQTKCFLSQITNLLTIKPFILKISAIWLFKHFTRR